MTTPPTNGPFVDILVGMGQVAAGQPPQRMKAILGSCIGLALYHPKTCLGVMAHIVLPESAGRTGAPGKFADTAVAHMLELLAARGAPPRGLIAKYAGGANMFGGGGPLQIGQANAEAVAKAMQGAGIRVAGQDIGGAQGRRIEFDFTNGQMTIQCAGQPARTL
ncbi:MAG: chemotaxis protein CheD [Pirellulaceae bacterium]